MLTDADFQRDVDFHIRLFPPGDVILREDDSGTEVYLVLSGNAEVHAAVDHLGVPGRSQVIGRIFENEVFGELALFDHQLRTASVVATSYCEVAVMDGGSLEAFMDSFPAKGYWILKDCFGQLAKRMRQATLRSSTITALYLNALSR